MRNRSRPLQQASTLRRFPHFSAVSQRFFGASNHISSFLSSVSTLFRCIQPHIVISQQCLNAFSVHPQLHVQQLHIVISQQCLNAFSVHPPVPNYISNNYISSIFLLPLGIRMLFSSRRVCFCAVLCVECRKFDSPCWPPVDSDLEDSLERPMETAGKDHSTPRRIHSRDHNGRRLRSILSDHADCRQLLIWWIDRRPGSRCAAHSMLSCRPRVHRSVRADRKKKFARHISANTCTPAQCQQPRLLQIQITTTADAGAEFNLLLCVCLWMSVRRRSCWPCRGESLRHYPGRNGRASLPPISTSWSSMYTYVVRGIFCGE